jgi:hypothetical protein
VKMFSDGHDDMRLRQARARARELRDSWRGANFEPLKADREEAGAGPSAMRAAREAAGRWLMDMGRRVRPAGAEPCA